MKRKYNWHCYQCGNKKNRKQFNNQDNFICSKCKYANKAESEDKKMKTYGDIYNEFCDKFPLAGVEDYRPAVEMHVPQLFTGIPNAIIVWLKDGTKVIYISESEDKE